MKEDDAVFEACRRFGEKAAVCKSGRRPAKYEIGYFEQAGNELLFYVMGSGRTLEKAFEQVNRLETEGRSENLQ